MPSLKDATKKPANVGEPIEVAAPAIAQRPPAPPYVPNPQGGLATGSMGPAPATFTTPYDSIRQFIRPGVAQNRFPPLPVKANPQSNAVARTIATQVAGSTVSKIELEAPSIFTLTDQTVGLPGPLVLALASEIENTVFAGPVSSAGSGGTDKTVSGSTVAANPYVLSATPSAYPEFAICGTITWAGGSVGDLDGSWTNVGWGGAERLGYKSVASGSSVASITGGAPLGAIMTLFKEGGTPPALVQNQSTSIGTVPGTMSLSFITPVTSGDMIFVQITGNGAAGVAASSVLVSDSAGNIYTNLGTLDVTSGSRYFISQWCCLNATGGALTITVTTAGGNSLTNKILGIAEFSSITKIVTTSVPTFRKLVDADLPIVDVPHGGTGLAALPAYSVLLGEGAAVIGSASPGTAGGVLMSNGPGADPSFQAIPDVDYYQTVQQAGSSKPQEPKLNFLAPMTATDNPGNTSTDIAVSVFVGSGASHATGLVPDPGASAGTTKFLREDGTWAVAGGAGTAVEVNGVGVSSDKQFYFNGVADVVSVWGVQINGASG